MERLELSRLTALPPQSSVSTSSTTSARRASCNPYCEGALPVAGAVVGDDGAVVVGAVVAGAPVAGCPVAVSAGGTLVVSFAGAAGSGIVVVCCAGAGCCSV